MEHIKEEKDVQTVPFKLEQIAQLSLPVWPLLWGFFASDAPHFLYILPAVIFTVFLRWMFYSVLELFPEDSTSIRSNNSIISSIIGLAVVVLLSYFLGGVAMFLLVLWLVAFGVYQMMYRDTWWPTIPYGILFGSFSVLFGNAASQTMNLGVIWVVLAAFFWVAAIETIRSGTSLDDIKNEHLAVVNQILGKWKISYAGIFFALSLIFLIITGLYNSAHGLYYAGLMVAEALMLLALIGVESSPEKACKRFYIHSAYASIIVCFTFALI